MSLGQLSLPTIKARHRDGKDVFETLWHICQWTTTTTTTPHVSMIPAHTHRYTDTHTHTHRHTHTHTHTQIHRPIHFTAIAWIYPVVSQKPSIKPCRMATGDWDVLQVRRPSPCLNNSIKATATEGKMTRCRYYYYYYSLLRQKAAQLLQTQHTIIKP